MYIVFVPVFMSGSVQSKRVALMREYWGAISDASQEVGLLVDRGHAKGQGNITLLIKAIAQILLEEGSDRRILLTLIKKYAEGLPKEEK